MPALRMCWLEGKSAHRAEFLPLVNPTLDFFFSLKKNKFVPFYVYRVLLACVSACPMHDCCSRRPEEGIGFPGTEVTAGLCVLCGWWDLIQSSVRAVRLLATGSSSQSPPSLAF